MYAVQNHEENELVMTKSLSRKRDGESDFEQAARRNLADARGTQS
jgi:uncharacterized protein YqeY